MKVFVTGGSGFIGQHVIDLLLQQKYTVKASFRRQDQIDKFTEFFKNSNFEPVLVTTSFSDPATFEPLLQDVELAIHLAAPLAQPCEDYQKQIIRPAIETTLSLLKAALSAPRLRRIVVTSTVGTICDFLEKGTFDESNWEKYEATDDLSGLQAKEDMFGAYFAAKTISEKAIWSFIDTHKPHFDVVALLPSIVIGKVLIREPDAPPVGTNILIWLWAVLGGPVKLGNGVSYFIDIKDAAMAHVKALDLLVEGNQRIIISGAKADLNSLQAMVEKKLPHEWKFGTYIGNDEVEVSNAKSKKVLDMTYVPLETLVVDTIAQYM